jgi:phosphoglucosamine mutase
MTKRYFGTDGIRGRVGESVVGPEFVLKLGWAVGRVLANGQRKKVLIGKDTRISGYMLESALEAGLSAAGVDIRLLGPMPTPAIAYLTKTFRASAGIIISASHNPYFDNGIKFFGPDGAKLGDDIESAIEAELEKPIKMVSPAYLGKAHRVDDAPGRYIEFCKSRFPQTMRLTGLKIVVDCANGATYHIAPNVFRELGAEVIEISSNPDGLNINDNCGSTSPASLQKIVKAEKAHLGVAFDGDGDRVAFVDEKGNLFDGDQIIYIIAKDRLEKGEDIPGVVGTVMSNLGLEIALNAHGIDFHRSSVGDRHVSEALAERGWSLGGENSGHIICCDKTTTGDGIVSSLQVLAAMQRSGKPLSRLCDGMTKFPQSQINVKVLDADALLKTDKVMNAERAAVDALKDDGRVLLRASGTEPLIRVMVEGKFKPQVEREAKSLALAVEEASLQSNKSKD